MMNLLPFIKEEKQKKTLKEEVVNRKKKIYTSIQETIKTAMAPHYEGESMCKKNT